MSTVSPRRPRRQRRDPSPCQYPTLDAERRASMCPATATSTRDVEGATLAVCEEHARAIDAKSKPVDWTDRDMLRRWFAEVSATVDDATAVTADMLQPFRERRLGPAEARRLHAEASAKLRGLLDAGERGLVMGSHATP